MTFGLCLLPDGPGGERPRLHFEETIFLFHRFARAPRPIGYALNNLAWTARAVGDADGGRAALDEALDALPRHRGPPPARR